MPYVRDFRIALGILVLVSHMGLSQSGGARDISYDINASIKPRADSMEVSAGCTMRLSSSTPVLTVLLNSSVKDLSIRLDGSNIPFETGGKDTLRLLLTERMLQEGTLSVRFHYLFPIDPLGDSLLLLSKGSHWYPVIPNQLAALRLRCEVPDAYEVLSAGNLTEARTGEGTSTFIWESKVPIFKIPIAVFRQASLRKNAMENGRKRLVLRSSSADSLQAGAILREAGNVFTYCTDIIGNYPFDGVTLIEVPYFEGIDISSGLVMIGSPSLHAMEKGAFEALHLAIAEQWIGAGVFAEFGKPGFFFFTISMPHYLRLMCVRQIKGDEAFEQELNAPIKQYEQFAGKEKDIPILDIDFPNTKEKGLLLYGKGPLIIRKVHDAMGDEAWKALLKDIFREYAGKILTYAEFQTSLAKHDRKGTALALFDGLMTRKGMPAE